MNEKKQAIMDVVSGFLESYSARDLAGCMGRIAEGRALFMLGTNEDEVFRSMDDLEAAFRRDFANMSDIRWGARRNIHIENDTSLASVLVEMPISYRSNGEEVSTIFRHSFTLVKQGDEWRICSGMASVPFSSGTYSFGS